MHWTDFYLSFDMGQNLTIMIKYLLIIKKSQIIGRISQLRSSIGGKTFNLFINHQPLCSLPQITLFGIKIVQGNADQMCKMASLTFLDILSCIGSWNYKIIDKTNFGIFIQKYKFEKHFTYLTSGKFKLGTCDCLKKKNVPKGDRKYMVLQI